MEAIGKFHMNHPLSNEGTFLKLNKQQKHHSAQDVITDPDTNPNHNSNPTTKARKEFPDLIIKRNKIPPTVNQTVSPPFPQ